MKDKGTYAAGHLFLIQLQQFRPFLHIFGIYWENISYKAIIASVSGRGAKSFQTSATPLAS